MSLSVLLSGGGEIDPCQLGFLDRSCRGRIGAISPNDSMRSVAGWTSRSPRERIDGGQSFSRGAKPRRPTHYGTPRALHSLKLARPQKNEPFTGFRRPSWNPPHPLFLRGATPPTPPRDHRGYLENLCAYIIKTTIIIVN